MSEARPIELSVVVPVYGCRDCLRRLYERLRVSVGEVTSRFELIFVDDRSPDGAWDELVEIAQDPAVRAFRLSRNFGQHAAITAGLSQAAGKWVVVMDCDLEEPPEEIPRLYAKAEEGFDIVHTARRERKHSRFRRMASRLYRYLMLDTETPRKDYGTLSLISRRVVDAFLRLPDKDREYLLVLDWLGFNQATVEFDHVERSEGGSSYTLSRLVSVALNGMFFRTTVLLRWVVALGFLIAIGGFLLAAYDIYVYARGDSPSGYTSLAVLLLLLAGFIIVSIGVIGLYVGRIFEQVKGRPLFIIDRRVENGVGHDRAVDSSGAITLGLGDEMEESVT